MIAPLVGLIGKKRAGKDTFAARLIAEHGFARVAFADPVREAALALDPWIDMCGGNERLASIVSRIGWERAKEIPEVRRILQNFGTSSIRAIDPDFWMRHGMEKARRCTEAGFPVVFTDVRFTNEARAIKAAGGILVRIERPSTDDGDTHASEVELDSYPVDRLVYNAGTVQQLNNQADALAASL